MPENVLLVGGLGFIGYHISCELAINDFAVAIAHRSVSTSQKSEHRLIPLDLGSMPIDVITTIIKDYDSVIFCGGADDRKMPDGDADAFFYRENVFPCLKLVEAAMKTNIKKVLILGSYLSHFDRSKPEWKLKERHPYIRSRHFQQIETLALAQNKVQVSIIEIPYVFGSAPEKTPLWKPLVDYVHKMPVIFYTKGGTNVMSVEQLAQAILGVLKSKKYKERWIVGSENVSWTELLRMISNSLGKKRRVISIPNFLARFAGSLVQVYLQLTGKQMGLDPYHYITVQSSNTFLDLEDSMKELAYDNVNIQRSINDTVRACGYVVEE